MLRRFPLIDGHNDLPWALRVRADFDVSRVRLVADGQAPSPDDPAEANLAAPVKGLHTDLPRLQAGGVGAQFWSVYVPGRLDGGAAANPGLASYPGALVLQRTAADVQRMFASGGGASLRGAEGGHAIASSLAVLRML